MPQDRLRLNVGGGGPQELPIDFTLPPHLRVQSQTASDQVVVGLREQILDGTLPSGARLPEVPLAEAFNVSRNTIREAIRALTQEGLARHDRNRSAVVADLTPEDVTDLYRVRRLLEISATERLDKLTADDEDALNGAFERLVALITLGEWDQVVSADLAFHGRVVALHHSPRLLRAFESVKSELAFCLALIRLYEHEDQHPDLIVAEHDEIRRALIDRDAGRSRELIAAHVDYYEERVQEALRERNAGPDGGAAKEASA